jgi:hypothetical protein
MNTKTIIRGVPGQDEWYKYLNERIPDAILYTDPRFHTDLSGQVKSTLAFLDALELSNDEPCIHMESDILLTSDWREKIEAEIKQGPDMIIQFFSMRKADITIGSRFDSTFSMNQCFYLPKGYGSAIYEYWISWPRKQENPGGYDIMMTDFLRSRKEQYWISIPSLVQHRIATSLANPKRSKFRLAKTFVP